MKIGVVFCPTKKYPYYFFASNTTPISFYLNATRTGLFLSKPVERPDITGWAFTADGEATVVGAVDRVCDYSDGVRFTPDSTAPSATLALPGTWSPTVPAEGTETVPMVIPGATPAGVLDVDALVQEILERVTKNELVVQPSGSPAPGPGTQPDEQAPDLDSLGLPALGAALTSRFPFSIPWDVVRGIKLLAAPAEAPYWEVDFLAPIAGRVGGWKGSTKVVIDMGQYEIIGQLCRWTSMIGFCLILAAGTKKLIWTA